MTYSVTVNAGVKDLVAPNGDRYQGGGTFTLSDRQAGLLAAGAPVARTYSGGTFSHQVTLADGLVNVVLPNGGRYAGGAVAVLSDEQYSVIPASTAAALFSADTTTLT